MKRHSGHGLVDVWEGWYQSRLRQIPQGRVGEDASAKGEGFKNEVDDLVWDDKNFFIDKMKAADKHDKAEAERILALEEKMKNKPAHLAP